MFSGFLANQRKEFIAGFLFLELSQHRAGYRARVLLLNSAHHHTQVLGFQNHADAKRFELLQQALSDLLGQAFLNLQATSKYINYSRYLTEANHLVSCEIPYVRLSEEG